MYSGSSSSAVEQQSCIELLFLTNTKLPGLFVNVHMLTVFGNQSNLISLRLLLANDDRS